MKPSRRRAAGSQGAWTPRQLYSVAIGAFIVLYWLFLARMSHWQPASSASATVIGEFKHAEPFGEPEHVSGNAPTARSAQEGAANVQVLEQQPVDSKLLRGADQPSSDNLISSSSRLVDDAAIAQTEAPEATSVAETAAAKTVSPPEEPVVPFEQRHDVVSGYDATLAYLKAYSTPAGSNEELFLFFVCSDEDGREFDWRRLCAEAKAKVYDVFAKAPASSRLVTIYAGSKKDWTTKNRFFDDPDLRVKAVPSIMRWEGGAPGAKRATYGMMIETTLLYEPLLRYLFKNTDQVDPLLASEEVATKEIVTVRGHAEYTAYMDAYNREADAQPMFLMLISGRMPGNDRLWCPYCRYSELSVEYAFYAYAPRGAKLLRVEVFDSYGKWKVKDNEFKRDTTLNVRGVPAFYRIYPSPGEQEARYQRVVERFDILESLQWTFQGSR